MEKQIVFVNMGGIDLNDSVMINGTRVRVENLIRCFLTTQQQADAGNNT